MNFFIKPFTKEFLLSGNRLPVYCNRLPVDENHETGQIQAKGLSEEGRRPKWRRTKPPSGEG